MTKNTAARVMPVDRGRVFDGTKKQFHCLYTRSAATLLR